MRDQIIVFGGIVTVLAAVFAWFLFTHERVEVDERGKPSALVESNPFYGFQQFLERYDIESQRLSSLNIGATMPDHHDTLVVGFEAVYLNDTENERIADWVSAGGHLVLPLPSRTDDSILAYFNIHSGDEYEAQEEQEEQSPQDSDAVDDEPPQEVADVVEESSPSTQTEDNDTQLERYDEQPDAPAEAVKELELFKERYVYNASFNGVPFGEFSVTYSVYDDLYSNRETQWTMELERRESEGPEDRRTYALGFQYGLGTVSLLSDYAHWNNQNFYEHDNALLSLAALTRVRETGKVWFVQTIRQMGLMELIWTRAAHLVIWLCVVITLFFWWAGQRIGRVLPNPSLERREFNEHLIASGRFLWSNNQRQKLLVSAQDALLNHARRRYPRLHTLNERQTELQLKDLLAEHYDLWTYAMQPVTPTTKPEFSELIKAIQKLWKLL